MNILLQLFLILLSVAFFLFLGLTVLRIISDILTETRQKLARHNVSIDATGASIGVKSKNRETLVDGMQRQFVGAWNKSQTLGKSHQ